MSDSDERNEAEPLLEVRGLSVQYGGRGRPSFQALKEIDLTIGARETVGLVGESGAGKSTLGRAILGIAPVSGGAIRFAGREITHAPSRERRALSRDLQVIFQDPYSSLNPARTIGQTLAETLGVHVRASRAELDAQVGAMLERVGLPAQAASRFPGDFSGGQRQRIAIARALIVGPRLVICDEPVSALDLSVQAQVLNLLREMQDDLHLSYLFVSHDLAVVKHVSHRIVVLYHGRVMEEGDAAALYETPLHPYTQALLNAAPVPDPREQARRREARLAQRAEASNSGLPQRGCVFASRCPYASELCHDTEPDLQPARQGIRVACHHWQAIAERHHHRPADHQIANGVAPR
jgi:oligopeptide/dipeptide ABC transporter ATP-binding protein